MCAHACIYHRIVVIYSVRMHAYLSNYKTTTTKMHNTTEGVTREREGEREREREREKPCEIRNERVSESTNAIMHSTDLCLEVGLEEKFLVVCSSRDNQSFPKLPVHKYIMKQI